MMMTDGTLRGAGQFSGADQGREPRGKPAPIYAKFGKLFFVMTSTLNNPATGDEQCVALAVSDDGYLIYIAASGAEFKTQIKATGTPGERYPIQPRRMI